MGGTTKKRKDKETLGQERKGNGGGRTKKKGVSENVKSAWEGERIHGMS